MGGRPSTDEPTTSPPTAEDSGDEIDEDAAGAGPSPPSPSPSPLSPKDGAPKPRSLCSVKVPPRPEKLNLTSEFADGDMARANAKLSMEPGVLGNAWEKDLFAPKGVVPEANVIPCEEGCAAVEVDDVVAVSGIGADTSLDPAVSEAGSLEFTVSSFRRRSFRASNTGTASDTPAASDDTPALALLPPLLTRAPPAVLGTDDGVGGHGSGMAGRCSLTVGVLASTDSAASSTGAEEELARLLPPALLVPW